MGAKGLIHPPLGHTASGELGLDSDGKAGWRGHSDILGRRESSSPEVEYRDVDAETSIFNLQKDSSGSSPGSPVVRPGTSTASSLVQSLVGELRPHKLHVVKKKKKKKMKEDSS